ncbi:MAG TPA: hypothetical protein DCS82_00485, partial [Rhodospirillaceae bacterium]|nr:hypothetical protein [Rhodospirillaceae bacterium]
ADKLARQIVESAQDADYVILGMRGVTEIDDTAIKILRQTDASLAKEGTVLQISYLHPESPLWGIVVGLASDWDILDGRTFVDGDTALSWAEDRLLETADLSTETEGELGLKDIDLLRGLGPEAFESAEKWFKRQTFAKDDTVILQGAPSDEMFLLAGGTVSIMLDIPGTTRQVRLAHLRPGVMFGEMGLITGEARSTHVVANEEVVVYVLDRPSYEELSQNAPEILATLLANISIELAARLRVTSAQVSELERNS